MKINADIDADFTEFKPDENLEAIRQEHEPFLTRLEALAVMALASGDWSEVYDHINFNAPEAADAPDRTNRTIRSNPNDQPKTKSRNSTIPPTVF